METGANFAWNNVSPTRNHCFHECQQVVKNHEMGLKGWTFGLHLAMGSADRGVIGDDLVALTWRWHGVDMALTWRWRDVQFLSPKWNRNGAEIARNVTEMAPKLNWCSVSVYNILTYLKNMRHCYFADDSCEHPCDNYILCAPSAHWNRHQNSNAVRTTGFSKSCITEIIMSFKEKTISNGSRWFPIVHHFFQLYIRTNNN